MKRLISITLALGLMLSTPFYSNAMSKTTTPPTIPVPQTLAEIIKKATPITPVLDFDQKTLHTATQLNPYTYTLEEKDFATNRWQRYIPAIYVQATDVSYITTIIYADGTLMQSVYNSLDAVQKLYESATLSNDDIKQSALAKMDPDFTAFYKTVYLQNYELLYSKTSYSYSDLSKFQLEEKFPDLLNKIYDSHQIYKKGMFYILTSSVYPSGNKVSYASSSIEGIEKQLNKLSDETAKLLIDNKLIKTPVVVAPAKPAVTFYAVAIFSDKTYSLGTFSTEAEAKAFIQKVLKINSKATVKILKDKAEVDKIIKNLKLKK